jgi:hypothetical protein
MSADLNDSNEEITAGSRSTQMTNTEWNQQTTVDARNVLQTQQSNEPSQYINDQRPGKSKISFFFC